MKRSEMISIISKKLKRKLCIDSQSVDLDKLANDILKTIEHNGMIPPNQYACTNEYKFEWEDE